MFEKLKNHVGHKIVCVTYGDTDNPQNICIECEDCNEILVSAETFDMNEKPKAAVNLDPNNTYLGPAKRAIESTRNESDKIHVVRPDLWPTFEEIAEYEKQYLKEPIFTEESLKILLRNTIDAYEDECDMNSAEHFVEKLKEETGITNEEYNELFKGDRQILEDGSVVTCKEEE